jgi:hypothetical protein
LDLTAKILKMPNERSLLTKLKSNLPWLIRYPFARTSSFFERSAFERKHVIFTVANHFEPSWTEGGMLDLDLQRRRLDEYFKEARKSGEMVVDSGRHEVSPHKFFSGGTVS